MPLDPSLSLQVQPAGGAAPAANPLGIAQGVMGLANTAQEMQARGLSIQSAQTQLEQLQQQFGARQKLGALMSVAPDVDTGLKTAIADPEIAKYPGLLNEYRQMQETLANVGLRQAETTKAQAGTGLTLQQTLESGAKTRQITAETGQGALKAVLSAATTGLGDPALAEKAAVAASLAYPPEVQQQIGQAAAGFLKAARDGLGPDPSKWTPAEQAKYQSNLSAMLVGNGVPAEGLGRLLGIPSPQFVTTKDAEGRDVAQTFGGGLVQPAAGPGAGPAPSPAVAPVPNPASAPGPGAAGGNSLQPQAGAGPEAGAGLLHPLGPVGPSQTETAYNTQRTDQMVKYQKSLDNRVSFGQQLSRNMAEMVDAAKTAQTGPGGEGWQKLAQIAGALGAPSELVDKLANGSLVGSTIVDKQALFNAMQQVRSQFEVEGRGPTEKELFETLEKTPGLSTDPRAMLKIFNLWQDFYRKDQAEQGALGAYTKAGGDIKDWPRVWANSDFMKHFAPSTDFTGEGVKGVPQAAAATYNSLDELKAATGPGKALTRAQAIEIARSKGWIAKE